MINEQRYDSTIYKLQYNFSKNLFLRFKIVFQCPYKCHSINIIIFSTQFSYCWLSYSHEWVDKFFFTLKNQIKIQFTDKKIYQFIKVANLCIWLFYQQQMGQQVLQDFHFAWICTSPVWLLFLHSRVRYDYQTSNFECCIRARNKLSKNNKYSTNHF